MSAQNTNVTTQKLIFACSGAADVGAIADLAARGMAKQGMGQLICLAAVAARIEWYISKAQKADAIVVVDGCGMDCGRKCLEHLGFSSFKHIRVTDSGLEKGKSLPGKENVQKVIDFARAKLQDN